MCTNSYFVWQGVVSGTHAALWARLQALGPSDVIGATANTAFQAMVSCLCCWGEAPALLAAATASLGSGSGSAAKPAAASKPTKSRRGAPSAPVSAPAAPHLHPVVAVAVIDAVSGLAAAGTTAGDAVAAALDLAGATPSAAGGAEAALAALAARMRDACDGLRGITKAITSGGDLSSSTVDLQQSAQVSSAAAAVWSKLFMRV